MFKLQGTELEEQRKKILKELEEKQNQCSKEADESEKKYTEISKIIDQLRRGKNHWFFIIPPQNEYFGGGILESACLSVRPYKPIFGLSLD